MFEANGGVRLAINTLIHYRTGATDGKVKRLLYIDPSGEYSFTFDVENPAANPIWCKYKDLRIALETGEADVPESDTYLPPAISESTLNSKEFEIFQNYAKRDWYIIEPLVTGDNAVKVLFPRERATLIKERSKELKTEIKSGDGISLLVKSGIKKGKGISPKSILRKLRRFWRHGQTQHAVASDYRNSGGAGKPRQAGEKKRGAPSQISIEDGRPTGVNVNDYWRDIIEEGCKLFYLNRKRMSFHKAYLKTLKFLCPQSTDKETSNSILPISNEAEVFTENQFKYHAQKYIRNNLKQAIIKRHGQRAFNLRFRDLKGESTSQAPWPGALYQIDATIADIYPVSSLNHRHILKRPVIWLLSDVFSHMIVGLCIRFEGEGWLGLKLALENTTVNKMTFCAEYGIKINEEIWPTCYLPDHITGDQGPLRNYNADYLSYYLNVHISNIPPYRPDWKGIIEQAFRRLNIKVIHGLPGAVDPHHERGDRDYRLAATITIYELTEILISTILYINNHHRMESYPLNRDMIADEVEPYPISLYNWGIENGLGSPRSRDQETIRLALLPEGEATVTERGIQFGPNLYTCNHAEDNAWRLKAKNYGRWKVKVGFYPRRSDIIYLRLDDSSPSIPCYLDKKSPFHGCDWVEIDSYTDRKKLSAKRATSRGLQAESDLDSAVDSVVAKATARTQAAIADVPEESKRARLQNMSSRTKVEIEHMQRAEGYEISDKESSEFFEPPLKISTASSEGTGEIYVPIPQPNNVRDIRERMLRDGQKKG